MRDTTGKLPTIRTRAQALLEIRKVALDKRGHVMMDEHCTWLELKLKVIARLAERGLKA